jgi:hypothetical protein
MQLLHSYWRRSEPALAMADGRGCRLRLQALSDQVGACTTVLQPLHALIERHVLAAERLHGRVEQARR